MSILIYRYNKTNRLKDKEVRSLQKNNAAVQPVRYKGIGIKKGVKKYWMLYAMMILPLVLPSVGHTGCI